MGRGKEERETNGGNRAERSRVWTLTKGFIQDEVFVGSGWGVEEYGRRCSMVSPEFEVHIIIESSNKTSNTGRRKY